MLKPNLNELSLLLDKKELSINEVSCSRERNYSKKILRSFACFIRRERSDVIYKGQELKALHRKLKRKAPLAPAIVWCAGFVLSLSQGKTLEDALKYGVACGAAATMNPRYRIMQQKYADELFHRIDIERK
jgi:6-phosphofructokinase 2